MTIPTKRLIAREWLTLLIHLLIGVAIMPLVIRSLAFLIEPETCPSHGKMYADILLALIFPAAEVPMIAAWVIVLFPYGVYQFIRSIVWAIRSLNPKEQKVEGLNQ